MGWLDQIFQNVKTSIFDSNFVSKLATSFKRMVRCIDPIKRASEPGGGGGGRDSNTRHIRDAPLC